MFISMVWEGLGSWKAVGAGGLEEEMMELLCRGVMFRRGIARFLGAACWERKGSLGEVGICKRPIAHVLTARSIH